MLGETSDTDLWGQNQDLKFQQKCQAETNKGTQMETKKSQTTYSYSELERTLKWLIWLQGSNTTDKEKDPPKLLHQQWHRKWVKKLMHNKMN